MPRGTYEDTLTTAEQVTPFDYIKLDTTGDYARICIPAPLPGHVPFWWEYVHSIKAPWLNDDGTPVLISIPNKRDGGTKLGYNLGFIGQRLCLGRQEVIEGTGRGLDTEACEACHAALEFGITSLRPERRFAVPVIKYNTTSRTSTEVRKPPNGDILVWRLNQRGWNEFKGTTPGAIRELLDLAEDAPVDFADVDLVLFCSEGTFQRVDLKPPLRSARKRYPEIGVVLDALWAEPANHPSEAQLRAACGRDGDATFMAADVKNAVDRWRSAEKFGTDPEKWAAVATATPVAGPQQDVAAQLDSLMADVDRNGMDEFAPASVPPPAAPSASFDEGGFDDDTYAAATGQPPAAAAAPALSADRSPAAPPPVPAANGSGAKSFAEIMEGAS